MHEVDRRADKDANWERADTAGAHALCTAAVRRFSVQSVTPVRDAFFSFSYTNAVSPDTYFFKSCCLFFLFLFFRV